LMTAQERRDLLRFAALGFEQDHLAMLPEGVRFAMTIALLQGGALLLVERDFQESAHKADTLAYFCRSTYGRFPNQGAWRSSAAWRHLLLGSRLCNFLLLFAADFFFVKSVLISVLGRDFGLYILVHFFASTGPVEAMVFPHE
jgi:hypothetical protein